VGGAAQAARAQNDGGANAAALGAHVRRVLSTFFGHVSESGKSGLANALQTGRAVNPDDPVSAQQIVSEYARVLNRDLERGRFPLPDDSLPFAKPVIKTAMETSLLALTSSGQLTEELRDFLETAFVALADYISPDLARLMREYSRAGDDLAADGRLAREKTTGAAWQTLSDGSHLAGEIARSMANEAEQLKAEFQRLITLSAARRATGGFRARTG